MRTFDWALFELYNEGLISFDEAIRNADSANELRLNIKLKSERGEPPPSAFMSLAIEQGPARGTRRAAPPGDAQAAGERGAFEEAQLAQLREKKRLAEGAERAKRPR
jgi:twitching motility protein PilU